MTSPTGSERVSTVPRVTLDSALAMSASSERRTLSWFGAGRPDSCWTVTVLSLSVNETPPVMSVRAQPSGTLTVNVPSDGLYGTHTWLSGMSPSGLDSVGVATVPADCPGEDEPPEPQPATSRAITAPRTRSRARDRVMTRGWHRTAESELSPAPSVKGVELIPRRCPWK